MVPSSVYDPSSEASTDSQERSDDLEQSGQESSEQSEEQSEEQSVSSAADSSEDTDESSGDQTDEGERKTASEPVDVAPDPEQTGMEIEKAPRLDQMDEDEIEEIRKERLDPENRPDNVEVDNTQRDFDTSQGRFEDSDLDPPESAPFFDPENPNEDEDDSGDDSNGDAASDSDG